MIDIILILIINNSLRSYFTNETQTFLICNVPHGTLMLKYSQKGS